MDDADKAQHLDERIRAGGLAHVRARMQADGADTCEDCGAPIEPERRRAMPSATRCVHCQDFFERPRRFRRR